MANARGVKLGVQVPRVLGRPPASQSSGPDAAALAADCGLVLEEWQRLVLDVAMGERGDASWAASEVGLIASRQNGKNGASRPASCSAWWCSTSGSSTRRTCSRRRASRTTGSSPCEANPDVAEDLLVDGGVAGVGLRDEVPRRPDHLHRPVAYVGPWPDRRPAGLRRGAGSERRRAGRAAADDLGAARRAVLVSGFRPGRRVDGVPPGPQARPGGGRAGSRSWSSRPTRMPTSTTGRRGRRRTRRMGRRMTEETIAAERAAMSDEMFAGAAEHQPRSRRRRTKAATCSVRRND
jgi:hypothetical protein